LFGFFIFERLKLEGMKLTIKKKNAALKEEKKFSYKIQEK
jgi:hypothetical protein